MIMAEKPPLFVFVRSGLNVPSPLHANHPRREIKNNIYNHGRSGIKRLSSILVAGMQIALAFDPAVVDVG